MINRNTLHKDNLTAFKAWLDKKGIPHRSGKGPWQKLQVLHKKYGWQCIFIRKDMPEYFSVQEKLMGIVEEFLKERRS